MSVDLISRGLAARARVAGDAGGLAYIRAARRIMRAAARGISPIGGVMASPPTYSEGASGANSTIITTATVSNGGGTFNTSDATKFRGIGWFTASASGTSGMTDRSVTKLNASTAGYRRGAHGGGFVFGTDADQFDICASWGSTPFIIYVTDLRTGIHARTQASDIVPSVTSTSYKKWVFADAGPRIIEVYPRFSATSSQPVFRGVNVPATANIWPVSFPDQPRIAWLGDRWGDTGGTTNTNAARLLAPDYFGERLGCRSVLSLSQGGSGLLNDSAGQGTLYQRAIEGSPLGDATGDLAISRIGALDMLLIGNSINDRIENNTAWTDAAAGAAMQTLTTAAMQAQPDALIIGIGPQQTRAVTMPQSRFDALKAGFLAAAGSDPRCLWIDNSPAGDQFLFGSSSTGNISIWIDSGDTNHLNDVGNAGWGRRVGSAVLSTLAARFDK
jgi:hypothetical protein